MGCPLYTARWLPCSCSFSFLGVASPTLYRYVYDMVSYCPPMMLLICAVIYGKVNKGANVEYFSNR